MTKNLLNDSFTPLLRALIVKIKTGLKQPILFICLTLAVGFPASDVFGQPQCCLCFNDFGPVNCIPNVDPCNGTTCILAVCDATFGGTHSGAACDATADCSGLGCTTI